MLKRIWVLAVILALAGCAGTLTLLADGEVHHGHFNSISKSVDVNINGRNYTGTFFQGVSIGFGTAFSGVHSATGTTIGSSGSGSAILTSADGKVLQCVFNAAFGQGQGQCQDGTGRVYALLIGQ